MLRKEQAHKEQFLSGTRNELSYAQDQFKYMCGVEERRFREQLRAEKQLVTARDRIQSLQQCVDRQREPQREPQRESQRESQLSPQDKENVKDSFRRGTAIALLIHTNPPR